MALTLAFMGYNLDQTRQYLIEFMRINIDQVHGFDPSPGRLWLKDGTRILAVPSTVERAYGLHFDQIIVACDRRGIECWPLRRRALLGHLLANASTYLVDDENRVIIYDLDAEEEPRC